MTGNVTALLNSQVVYHSIETHAHSDKHRQSLSEMQF